MRAEYKNALEKAPKEGNSLGKEILSDISSQTDQLSNEFRGTLVVDPRQDDALKNFLASPEVRAMRGQLPVNATVDEEAQFLQNLISMTQSRFKKTGTVEQYFEELRAAKPLDNFPDTYIMPSETGFIPTKKLGHALTSESGVCVHHAVLNKLILDELLDDLSQPGIETSVKTGFLKLDPTIYSQILQGGTANDLMGHAWNTVTFPSGRKWLVDSATNFMALSTIKDQAGVKRLASYAANPATAIIEKRKATYLNINQLQKQGRDIMGEYQQQLLAAIEGVVE